MPDIPTNFRMAEFNKLAKAGPGGSAFSHFMIKRVSYGGGRWRFRLLLAIS